VTEDRTTHAAAPPRVENGAPRRALWPRLLLAILLISVVAGFYLFSLDRYISLDYLRDNRDHFLKEADDHLLLALLLFFVVYTALTALSVPAAWVLTLIGGALFDRWLGTAVVSAASTCGATLAFLTSRYLLQDFVQRRFGARLRRLNEGIEKDGAYYLLTLRLVVIFPFYLVNLGMGLTTIRLRTYVWVSWLGMLPATFLYCNVGAELRRVDSVRAVVSPSLLISLALLGVAPVLIRKLLQWLGKKE
jgi:uncharacterized membrane protein YdjX (TVP38/TMEM64 family)